MVCSLTKFAGAFFRHFLSPRNQITLQSIICLILRPYLMWAFTKRNRSRFARWRKSSGLAWHIPPPWHIHFSNCSVTKACCWEITVRILMDWSSLPGFPTKSWLVRIMQLHICDYPISTVDSVFYFFFFWLLKNAMDIFELLPALTAVLLLMAKRWKILLLRMHQFPSVENAMAMSSLILYSLVNLW